MSCVCVLQAMGRIEDCSPSSLPGESSKSGHGYLWFGREWRPLDLQRAFRWSWGKEIFHPFSQATLEHLLVSASEHGGGHCRQGVMQSAKTWTAQVVSVQRKHWTRGTGDVSTPPGVEIWAVAAGTELDRCRVKGEVAWPAGGLARWRLDGEESDLYCQCEVKHPQCLLRMAPRL